MSNGKGSRRRESSITESAFKKRWLAIFRAKAKKKKTKLRLRK